MDVRQALKQIPDNSIDCVVCSPPYFSLRSYLPDEHPLKSMEIGTEDHPQKYIDNLVDIFREVKRVIKPSGSIWLNLGDLYYTKSGSNFKSSKQMQSLDQNLEASGKQAGNKVREKYKSNWLQPKQKLLMPHRVAIALQDELGLILRNDVVWAKTAYCPSSVPDRLTTSFEFLFHFVKQRSYYYDLDAIRVPYKDITIKRVKYGFNKGKVDVCGPINSKAQTIFGEKLLAGEGKGANPADIIYTEPKAQGYIEATGGARPFEAFRDLRNPEGRNPSDLWKIGPENFSGEHYACFPSQLVRTPLLASCPKQVCKVCGKPRIKLYKVEEGHRSPEEEAKLQQEIIATGVPRQTVGLKYPTFTKKTFIGLSECDCGKKGGYEVGIVLDIFLGSGQTLLVAQELGLRGIGCEINEAYLPLLIKRLHGSEHQTSLQENKIEVIK